LKEQISNLSLEIKQIKERDDFKGIRVLPTVSNMSGYLERLKDAYKKRRCGCIDMLDRLSE
jgi:hypothetical protein